MKQVSPTVNLCRSIDCYRGLGKPQDGTPLCHTLCPFESDVSLLTSRNRRSRPDRSNHLQYKSKRHASWTKEKFEMGGKVSAGSRYVRCEERICAGHRPKKLRRKAIALAHAVFSVPNITDGVFMQTSSERWFYTEAGWAGSLVRFRRPQDNGVLSPAPF